MQEGRAFGSKKNWGFFFSSVLLALLFFAIPIEHKYDKLFRNYSLTLCPEGLVLPRFFERKIFFYGSDLIICLLLGWMFLKRTSVVYRSGALLGAFACCAFFSIVASPLHHYPVLYAHFFQFLTSLFLFFFLANGPISKERLFQITSFSLFLTSCMEALFAIPQYFLQRSLGLRLLNEHPLTASISVPNGRRWIFDSLFQRVAENETVYRAAGTLSHANVLGGVLVTGLLLTTFFLWKEPKKRIFFSLAYFIQLFALGITYSRSALFAYFIGTTLWFFWMWRKTIRTTLKFPALIITCSLFCMGTLLYEQYLYRGGVFNYPQSVAASDQLRFLYQEIGMQMVSASPVIGVGFDQFSLHASSFLPQGANASLLSSGTIHNIYLLIAVEFGSIALFFFLFWIARILWVSLRATSTPEARILLCLFLAFLFIGCCDFYLITSQQGRLLFFGISGLLTRFIYELKISQSSSSKLKNFTKKQDSK